MENKATDVVYNQGDILSVAGYDSLPYTCSAYVVAIEGRLQKHSTYTVGFIESAIKVTKNYTGPKIEYLVGTGLMKINSGEKALETVDFTVFGDASNTSAGYDAKLVLTGGNVSIFDMTIGLGVSSAIGIVDDSATVKALGCGIQVGRKIGISVI